MWKEEFSWIYSLKAALRHERERVEARLRSLHAYNRFKARPTEVYISYLRDVGTPGPYPITNPYVWQDGSPKSLESLYVIAANYANATGVYARIMLSAQDRDGNHIFPAGRVDLKIATRIATALPEEHPARVKPKIKKKAPIIFYDERSVD